jgi:hypothetical protein
MGMAFPTNSTLKVKEAYHHVAFLWASKTTQQISPWLFYVLPSILVG